MQTFETITNNLKSLCVSFEAIIFPDSVAFARDTDNSLTKNYNPSESVKTVIIVKDNSLIALLVRGHDLIDGKKLQPILGKKWRMANTEELATIGFVPGTVCPLALPKDMPIYVDQKLLDLQNWNIGSGDLGKGLSLTTANCMELIKPTLVSDISKPKS